MQVGLVDMAPSPISFFFNNRYPSVLCVPTECDDALVRTAAEFRSKHRLPVLTYVHNNGAALLRSAQPRVGVLMRRNAADEALLAATRAANPNEHARLFIADARPKMNAMANMANGKVRQT